MQNDRNKGADKTLLDQRLLATIRERTAGRFMVVDNPAFLPVPFFLLTAPGEALQNIIHARKNFFGKEAETELQILRNIYDRNMVIRDNGTKTYRYSAAVERRRLDLLEETMKSGLPKDIFTSMRAYRASMEELWERNRQPFSEVRDAEYLPYMLALLKKRHPDIGIKTFAGLDWVATWLQTYLDSPAHVISLVNAGNHLHQCAVSLHKGKQTSSIIILDSIHWTWNWHWQEDVTRKSPAPGYKAVADFARLAEASPRIYGAYISMNVQKAPMNCAIHGLHFLEQMYFHTELFLQMHENLEAGRPIHPLAREACAPEPYAREVSGLECALDPNALELLRLHGSAYRDAGGTWERLPYQGFGKITLTDGLILQDLGHGSQAVHITSVITALTPDIDLMNGAHMHFTADNGSLRMVRCSHKPAA